MRRRDLRVRLAAAALASCMIVETSGLALAAGDTAQSVGTPSFSDAAPPAQAAAASVGGSNQHKGRGVPVSSTGSFGTGVAIDLPPGRGAMRPSLAMAYDSGSARPSAVGAGWSFGAPSIARSTKNGFPPVSRVADIAQDVPGFAYVDAGFVGSAGELVAAADGPTGATRVYQPEREHAPVRYEYLPKSDADATGGAWVEHLPSGVKRYFGRDPFTGREARISNELGTFAWPLLREEDVDGNEIIYEYHGLSAQTPDGVSPDGVARPRSKDRLKNVQRAPVLASVRWGGNRKTGLSPTFWARTDITHQSGLVDMAGGGVVLEDRIDAIRVGRSYANAPDETYWTYTLGYAASADTGKLLLKSVTRAAPGETPRVTKFDYSAGTSTWAAAAALPAELEKVYGDHVIWRAGRDPFDARALSEESVFDPTGFRMGTKFVDVDGNGELDAVYHPSGVETTSTHVPFDLARLQSDGSFRTPSGADGPFAMNTSKAGLVTMLGDLDGDGDQDGLSFPLRYALKGAGEDRIGTSFLRNRTPMPLAHCATRAFWEQQCPGVEPLSPWVNDRTAGTECERKVTACMTQWLEDKPALDGMFVRIAANTSRASGARVPVWQALDDWPAEVDQEMRVISGSGGDGGEHRVINDFASYIESDFNAPLVDLNGDGRNDLVLLKHLSRWHPSGSNALVAPHTAIKAWDALAPKRGVMRLPGPLSKLMGPLASNPLPFLVDENLWFGKEDFTSVVSFEATAGEVGLSALNPARKVRVLTYGIAERAPEAPPTKGIAASTESALVASPAAGLPGGGPSPEPLPDIGPIPTWSGPVPFPLPLHAGKRPPPGVFWPTGIGDERCGTLHWPTSTCPPGFGIPGSASSSRAPGCVGGYGIPGSMGDGGLITKASRFVPRAYLSLPRDGERALLPDTRPLPGGVTADFSASLDEILTGGRKSECNTLDCVFPAHVNWSSFFLDVNGDGLADLIVAEPPSNADRLSCKDGHRVYLNRGYTFEEAPGQTLPSETWSSRGDDAAPLSLLYNRDQPCRGSLSALSYVEGTKARFPMAAMAPVDINGDGLVDLVFARKVSKTEGDADGLTQKIFLNTGRGFAPAETVASGYAGRSALPAVALAMKITPFDDENGTPRRPPTANWPDTARFADLDGDGLEDIVQSGRCTPVITPGGPGTPGLPGLPGTVTQLCTPGQWYRNTGTVPDMLTRVTQPAGAWTEIDYAPPRAPLVTGDPAGKMPVPSRHGWIVAAVRSAAGPRGTTPSGDSFPIVETSLHYAGYTRDPERAESLGYTSIVAEHRNAYAGSPRELVRVSQTFDTQAAAPGVTTPYPRKGLLVREVRESGTTVETTSFDYDLRPLGGGVRVRRASSSTKTCEGTECAESVMRDAQWDALGYTLESAEGNAAGGALVADDEQRTSSTTYAHDRATWILGQPATEIVRGFTEHMNGLREPSSVLANRAFLYDNRGHLTRRIHKGITADGCAGDKDAFAAFTYTPEGLVETVTASGHAQVTLEYDALKLFPTFHTSRVSRFDLDGKIVGTTDLKTTSIYDARTGELRGYGDTAGSYASTTFDSLGRPLDVNGPDGSLREQYTYFDETLPRTRVKVFGGPNGTSFERWSYQDGEGNVLATVEGSGTTEVPFSRTGRSRHDAFGRTVESYLPRFVSSADDRLVGTNELHEVTTYDGFDRTLTTTRADGALTKFSYGPRWSKVVDPRGLATRKFSDARGRTWRVERLGSRDGVVASHEIVRNGLGAIVKLTDPDGDVRRFERDGGGRLHRVELPHHVGATATTMTACHALDDTLVRAVGPDGRVTEVTRDEIGRPIATRSTLPGAAPVTVHQAYDDPTLPFSVGRLSRVRDDAGDRTLTYDAFGRSAQMSWSLSAAARVSSAVAPTYRMTMAYDGLGALHTADFEGGAVHATLRYDRDAKGRAHSITSVSVPESLSSSLVTAARYDAEDRVVEAAFGNKTYGAWDFDAATGNLSGVRFEDATSARKALGAVGYLYDANANPTREARVGAGGRALVTKDYAFDELDRLSGAILTSPSASTQTIFTYSPGGNLVRAGLSTYTYEAPSSPQAVSRVTDGSGNARLLSYDVRGALVGDVDGAHGGEERTLAYDASGCAASATLRRSTGASVTASYVCNSEGKVAARRVVETSQAGALPKVLQAVVNLDDIAEIRADEGVVVLRVPLAGSAAVEQAFSLVDGRFVADKSAYLHKDLRGSVLATTAWDGAVISRDVDYDPWGASLPVTTADAPRRRFVDHEPDAGFGYYHFGARPYDPTLRRWLALDPLMLLDPELDEHDGQQLNLYQYARNNPVAVVDPSGMFGEELAEKIRNSRFAMGAVGFAAGLMQGFTPGAGFIPALPSPRCDNAPMFRHWQAAGLTIGGTVELLVGKAAIGGGGLLAGPTGGTTLTVSAAGVVALASGVAKIEQGVLIARQASVDGNVLTSNPPSESPPVATTEAPKAPVEKTSPVEVQSSTQSAPPAPVAGAGTSGGARAGKAFTPKGKAEIDAANANRNGGTNVCEKCTKNVVPGKKSEKGVAPPANERQRDHIIPKSKGGNGDSSNGQVLCRECNLEKSDKTQ